MKFHLRAVKCHLTCFGCGILLVIVIKHYFWSQWKVHDDWISSSPSGQSPSNNTSPRKSYRSSEIPIKCIIFFSAVSVPVLSFSFLIMTMMMIMMMMMIFFPLALRPPFLLLYSRKPSRQRRRVVSALRRS